MSVTYNVDDYDNIEQFTASLRADIDAASDEYDDIQVTLNAE